MAKPSQAKKPAAKKPRQAKAKPPATAKTPAPPAPKKDRRGTPKGKGVVARNGGRIGNPAHAPDDESRRIVETHAAVGTPQWAIAAELEISEDTLTRHYRRELDMGLHRMNARIGSSVAKKALDGDDGMQKFWLARRGGPAWANKAALEHSGPSGGPIEHQHAGELDLRRLSREELKALRELQRKAKGGDGSAPVA